MELIEINWEFIFFGFAATVFVVVFIVMMNRRNKMKDGENHDPWRDDY